MARITFLLSTLFVLLTMVGCGSHEKYVAYLAEKKALLAAAFPAGMSRAEVHAKLKADSNAQVPMYTGTRPATGWVAEPPVRGGSWCAAAEVRTGRVVTSFDNCSMVDGLFSLCYCWFYYDEADTLVDVDWQYQSD